jgi:hypothetical protein
LAGIIAELEKHGRSGDAIFTAMNGRHFNDDVEKFVYILSISQKMIITPSIQFKVRIMSQGDSNFRNLRAIEKMAYILKREAREVLCELFLDAIERGDEEQLSKFPKAIKFVKKYNPRSDDTRSEILCVKRRLKNGETWSIGQLARYLKRPQSESINGYATLLRIAKQLDFPLRTRN